MASPSCRTRTIVLVARAHGGKLDHSSRVRRRGRARPPPRDGQRSDRWPGRRARRSRRDRRTADLPGTARRLRRPARRRRRVGGPRPGEPAMIRHWAAAFEDDNPVYTDPEAAAASRFGQIVAPPLMLQTWTMADAAASGASASGGLTGRVREPATAHRRPRRGRLHRHARLQLRVRDRALPAPRRGGVVEPRSSSRSRTRSRPASGPATSSPGSRPTSTRRARSSAPRRFRILKFKPGGTPT